MCFDDEEYTPQYYNLDTAPGDEDMEYERHVDGKENRVKRNHDAFLSDDSANIIHKRSQTFYEDMELATNLTDRRVDARRKSSSDEKRRRIFHESCNPVASTSNALPVTNTFSEAVNSITGENSLSLVKLGKLVRQFEFNLENKELLATKMKEVNAINLQQIKSMQNAIDTMRPSSDSVVRTLTGIIKEQSNIIAGLSLTVDTILSNQQEHSKQLWKASYHIAKSNEVTLPAEHNVNMIELFENWTQPSRANKNDPFLLMMDFYRFYFLHACQPKQEIQKFACRQSGKRGRFPHLQDLPESLVTFLINFVLDGVRLYAEKLLLSATECARQRNRLWLGLGKDDEARTKTFDKLSEARMKLSGLARVALGRALGDVRAYHFDADKGMLSPPSKKRFCPTTTQDSSAHEQANKAEHDKDEAIESVQSI